MPEEYTREQLWKLYEKLPQELKEVIFSEETADSIWEICSRNGVEDERISEIARYTGRVLMGILPPAEFQETLEKELKLEKETAKKVAREINRLIFYPARTSLEELYKIEITPFAPPTPKAVPVEEKPVPPKEAPPKPAEEKPKKEDIYREPVE